MPHTPSDLVGKAVETLTTPALLLDYDKLQANIAKMASHCSGHARLRAHAKAHKCYQIAKMQMEAGAIGITTATIWEAAALAKSPVDDILVANEVVGPAKITAAAKLAGRCQLTVAVDDAQNAAELAAAARRAKSQIGVFIDIDTGMNRCGVRSTEAAVALAKKIASLEGLLLRGVTGYEGHCVLIADRPERAQKAHSAMDYLVEVTQAIRDAGVPAEIISAGGTGTYNLTGQDPRITEIQAGSYALMDATRAPLVDGFLHALTVLSTVVSRQDSTVVLDTGRKTIGVEFTLPQIIDVPHITIRAAAEEHLLFDITPGCPLKVGDLVQLIPGYAPTTANLYPFYHVVKNGRVADIWPLLARTGVNDDADSGH